MSSIPLGKRLESLEIENKEDIMKEMKETTKKKVLPKSRSMEVILTQYLETGDYSQIDRIINAKDKNVSSYSTFRNV